jgi:hypothetical protein
VKARLLVIFMGVSVLCKAQLLSPEQFFGHQMGSTFHRHHQMEAYVQHAVGQASNRSKLLSYGKTYEDRPLMVLAIASPKNMAQLEQIRISHLQTIGLADGTATVKVPAIAWLSYNVHGNEPVSMEAAMEVIYRLLENKNGEYDSILNQTIVLIDPCINPDGRDRYANWYNSIKGQSANALALAREHKEPWPQGRTNHYMYDLNRDWAWLVQKESQQRLQLYNQWMPHLHADFHEQGYGQPYYFPPAAKPYHEDLSLWQRSFQQKLGEYNKKEFDRNGWLYFSKERFDLLYPSYGDTYPSYNGAAGMTYEQGGIAAGLAVQLPEGDTLTLAQRISHHVATSFAALSAISHDADKNVGEFVRYFEQSRNATKTPYQTYIIKSTGVEQRLAALRQLLDQWGISYGAAGKTLASAGYSYTDQKIMPFKIEPNDLAISLNQPRAVLAKVLFEPKSMVEDSITYDITAWSMPIAYGVQAYALKEKLLPVAWPKTTYTWPGNNTLPYAYLIGHSSVAELQLQAKLLKNGYTLRQAELPFNIEGKNFAAGTVVLTKAHNQSKSQLMVQLKQWATELQVPISEVNTGMATSGFDIGSPHFRHLKTPKILLVGGENFSSTAVGDVWHFLDQQLQFPSTFVLENQLNTELLNNFDVLILANNRWANLPSSSITDWVKAGGKLLLMENAINTFVDKPGFEIKHKEAKKDSINTIRYENAEREAISNETPGSIYEITLDNSHPLALGYGPKYLGLINEATDYQLLKTGWNVGQIKNTGPVAGFAGAKAQAKLKNSLMVGAEEQGKGKIVYMAFNPLFRGFWYHGKALFWNALMW